jgi:hypothetical protein
MTTPQPDGTDEFHVPPLAICSGCGVTAPLTERGAPTGWLVARPVAGWGSGQVYGACPACADDSFTFRYPPPAD